MATHDYVIANGTGAAVRSDLNDALAAIVSNNSSSTAPATTYAYQWWADTTANVLKIRNSANNAWITLRELDGTMLMEDGDASAPGLAFAADLNTGLFRPQADAVGFSAGGAERIGIGTTEVVVNNPSNDVDFRVESDGVTHMLFVDAGLNRVGIGASSPGVTLDISAIGAATRITSTTGTNPAYVNFNNTAGNAYVGLESSSGGGAASGNAAYALHLSHQGAYPINFSTNNALRATIDSSGSFLLGLSSALTGTESQYSKFIVQGASSGSAFDGRMSLSRGTAASSLSSGSTVGSIYFTDNGSNEFAAITAAVDGTTGASDAPGRLMFSTTADGASTPTERMRISANGQISLGDSAIAGNFKVFAKNSANSTTDITYYSELLSGSNHVNASHFYAITQGVAVYRLTGNGTSTFTSDERKKKNIETTRDGYLEDLRDLRVVKYNWVTQDDDTPKELGLIAQEVEQVFPGLVAEESEPMEGDDYKLKTLKGSVLPFMLLKALQEAAEKIETLEAKVAALEAG